MFDEQPDGDPHGECAAEIHRLMADLAAAQRELASYKLALDNYLEGGPLCVNWGEEGHAVRNWIENRAHEIMSALYNEKVQP